MSRGRLAASSFLLPSWVSRSSTPGSVRVLVFALLLLFGPTIEAQPTRQTDPGLLLNRFEPTPAGESSFRVDVPRFGSNVFSFGLGLGYAHRPLVLGVADDAGKFQTLRVLVEHQALGHLDLAFLLCGCASLSVSLPLVLLEPGRAPGEDLVWASSRGLLGAASPLPGLSRGETRLGSSALEGLSLGDPRLGVMLRVYGIPDESPFSVSFGAYLWLPLRGLLRELPSRTSEQEPRAMPRLVLAGAHRSLRWSLVTSYLLRTVASENALSPLSGDAVGSELQVGTQVSYSDKARGLSVGPEVTLSTLVNPRGHAFRPLYTDLEALLGLHVQPLPALRVGLAAGVGLLRRPGTPDLRFLLRVAYTLPSEVARPAPARAALELPPLPPPLPLLLLLPLPPPLPEELDGDGDGVPEPPAVSPDPRSGEPPDASPPGSPASDRDQDSVPDDEDACPDVPGAPSREVDTNGCPGLVEVKGHRLLLREPIVFATNTATVLARSFPVLQALADALGASPWIKRVRFEGHTDNQGTVEANQELSLRRARSVMRWLQEHGVDPGRMEARGEGPAHPIASNDTEPGRAANRRVDIVILDPAAAPEGHEPP